MQTITIQGDRQNLDKIIKLIRSSDINVDIIDYPTRSIDEIRAEVADTREQIKNGTMKLYTFDESYKRTETLLKNLSAKI